MSEIWGKIVTGAELNKARLERRKDYVFDRFHIDTQEAMEQQGWEYVSTYKRGDMVRMRKPKAVGNRFENKVWLMLYAMGYTDMNSDNSFVIQYDQDYPNLTKQIDISPLYRDVVQAPDNTQRIPHRIRRLLRC